MTKSTDLTEIMAMRYGAAPEIMARAYVQLLWGLGDAGDGDSRFRVIGIVSQRPPPKPD